MKTIKLVITLFLITSLLHVHAQTTTASGVDSGSLGDHNSFYGYSTGKLNLTGASYNTFIGSNAGKSNTDGDLNVFVGSGAGTLNTTGGRNTFLGHFAGTSNTTAKYNTFTGFYSGRKTTTGGYNAFYGQYSGYENITGAFNAAFGASAGVKNLSGSYNAYLGYGAGRYKTTGSRNTFVGSKSGYNNLTGDKNVFIGNDAGYNETGSEKLYIDNSDTSTPLLYGNFSTDQLGVNTNVIPVGYTFAVKGKMIAEQVKVQVYPWSDFVFEEDYRLPTLKEVEEHIKEKGHLEHIPSAKEVHENGISLGDMDAKLLQKIEELTLYTIAQEKKIDAQAQKIKELKVLKSRLDRLEKLLTKK